MKIALLSKAICEKTIQTIHFFNKNNIKIDLIIIETGFRINFSEPEKFFRKAHDLYNSRFKKYSLPRRLTKRVYDLMPMSLHKLIYQNIYNIPILNKYSSKVHAKKNNIPYINVKKHSSEETKQAIISHNIDYALLMSSNWLIKEPLLSIPGFKIINSHPGMLPKHRGLDSMPWSISIEDPIGISTYFVTRGIDDGPILKFYEIEPKKGDTIGSLSKSLKFEVPKCLADTLMKLSAGELSPIEQPDDIMVHRPMSFNELLDAEEKLQSRISKMDFS